VRKIILHIDFDSFFASCEQQFNPLLRNRPLGVTATNGRTCIIASSREAKRLGIKTGSRTYEALRICPGLNLVGANFVKYLEVSKKFLKICRNFSPDVELFSIDEVFMDATLTNPLFGGAYEMIEKLKKEIKEKIGEHITVSVGISHNRLLAKLASGLKKPSGLFEITENNIWNVYSDAELTDVCGIGERIKLRLNKIGVHTLLQLRDIGMSLLVQEFGNCEGHFLKNIGLGIDSDSLNSYTTAPPVKSVGRNYCLPKNEYDKKIVLRNVYELCEEVCLKLRRLSKKARTVGFYISGDITRHGRKTYKKYFDTGKEMFDSLTGLVDFKNFNYVRQIGVMAMNLEDTANAPLSLFDSPRKNNLTTAIDKINDRFGDHTIRNGFLLYSDKLTTVPNGYMADKFERAKLANENV
jgi:DNA polymerase IV